MNLLENMPPPPELEDLNAEIIWGERCENGDKKSIENVLEKGRKRKDKANTVVKLK